MAAGDIKLSTNELIARDLRLGHKAKIRRDDAAAPDSWYIDCGENSYCYYRTRRDAETTLMAARALAAKPPEVLDNPHVRAIGAP